MRKVELWGYTIYEDGRIIGLHGKEINYNKQIKVQWGNKKKAKMVYYARFVYYAFNYKNFNFNDKTIVIQHINGDNKDCHINNLVAVKRKFISQGQNNGLAKLTDAEVQLIRKAYANHKKQRDIYELFSDKISFGYFQNLWQGRSWAHIMPEVFTEENKKYYISENSKGENGASATFTNQEVIELRTRYVKESAKAIYEDYKERISYSALQQILWGRYYSDLPIYNKKEKRWINT